MSSDLQNWKYKTPPDNSRALHIQVIADYGGGHTTDHAFSEVRNHFFRFDKKNILRDITEQPVYAFSTLETGFWISQIGLHSEHKNLVIFSNTAPRGDIKWGGENEQNFVCGLLDNGIPIFAVNAGYNLSFVRHRLSGLWEVKVPNIGTQFRSRDYYPSVTVSILEGDTRKIGKPVDLKTIPDVPKFTVASIDGYGNIKTTIHYSHLSEKLQKSTVVRITINGETHFALNCLYGRHGKIGDLCLVKGSSGGKKSNYVEVIRLQARAADLFHLMGPRDDRSHIKIEKI
ncbi:SAM-dependent chlorinase/fluorinase [Candidatus Gottesmanbacteria bacterium]|nr:SAM-dependent chlorinase/fluorinase [Candidatus Gottesmanbacteria bacterium]